MTLSKGQFEGLHRNLVGDEGGFSVDVKTGASPKVGYMVSIPGFEQQVRSQNVAPAHLEEYVRKHGSELDKPGAHFGGWNNKDAGEVSLDVSRNIKPKSRVAKRYGAAVADADARTSASDMAVAHNQEAAWDVARGREVPNPGFDPSRRR